MGCEKCANVSFSEPTLAETEWLVYGNLQKAVADQQRDLKDTILFLDEETKDTIRYFRTGIYAQSLPGDGYSIEDQCIEQLNTQMTNIIEDESKRNPLLATSILSKPDSLLIRIGVDKTGSWAIDPNGVTLPQMLINGKEYYDVYELTGTGTKPTDVKKLYFNKEYGFLEVHFVNDKKKLSLLEIL
ncbi:hypothetical protein GCM10007389_36490 [Pontibacter akesuensis]|nr:hypothetical protein GCM10007389_36490 [Pontibacter akesuensis]